MIPSKQGIVSYERVSKKTKVKPYISGKYSPRLQFCNDAVDLYCFFPLTKHCPPVEILILSLSINSNSQPLAP